MIKLAEPLAKAVYQSLNGDLELTNLIGVDQIFDHQAKGANYPYILMVNWNSSDWSFDGYDGEEHRFDLEIYDDQPSLQSVRDIACLVEGVLHDQNLTLTSGTLVNLRLENSFFQTQRRTNIQLSRLKFRAKTEV